MHNAAYTDLPLHRPCAVPGATLQNVKRLTVCCDRTTYNVTVNIHFFSGRQMKTYRNEQTDRD